MQRIIEAEKELSLLKSENAFLKGKDDRSILQLHLKEEYIQQLEFGIRELLAVVFRDGGHKTAEFGLLQEAMRFAQHVVAKDYLAGVDALADLREMVPQTLDNCERALQYCREDAPRGAKELIDVALESCAQMRKALQ